MHKQAHTLRRCFNRRTSFCAKISIDRIADDFPTRVICCKNHCKICGFQYLRLFRFILLSWKLIGQLHLIRQRQTRKNHKKLHIFKFSSRNVDGFDLIYRSVSIRPFHMPEPESELNIALYNRLFDESTPTVYGGTTQDSATISRSQIFRTLQAANFELDHLFSVGCTQHLLNHKHHSLDCYFLSGLYTNSCNESDSIY